MLCTIYVFCKQFTVFVYKNIEFSKTILCSASFDPSNIVVSQCVNCNTIYIIGYIQRSTPDIRSDIEVTETLGNDIRKSQYDVGHASIFLERLQNS